MNSTQSVGSTGDVCEHKKQLEWLLSDDTGTSSETIFAVMTKTKSPKYQSVPLDPDDFGRCFRLLKRFPAWKDRLVEVALFYPEWGPLVREWERLSEMYRKAVTRDDEYPSELYLAMQSLIAEGRKAKESIQIAQLKDAAI